MTLGSLTNREHRQVLCAQMVSHYKAIQALNKRLGSKKYTRQYRDQTCDSAVKQREDRSCVIEEMERHQKELLEAFAQLPEVRHDKTLQMRGPAIRFAMELAQKPKNPKYLRTQGKLLP